VLGQRVRNYTITMATPAGGAAAMLVGAGFGRIIVPDIEAPNILVNMIYSGGGERSYDERDLVLR
jgi:hypothetical protein